MTIIAAADGSALGNPGPAGWAWVVDDTCWASGGWPHGTNNMGELMAVLDLLRQTAHTGEPVHVLCDSQYAIKVSTTWMAGWKAKNWRKKDGKPVLNVELVKALDAAMAGREVTFEWVRGHAGHPLNEAADTLARAAATAYRKGQEAATGPGFPGAADSGDDRFAPGQREPEAALFPLEGLEIEVSDSERVIELERSLLSDAVRGDPSQAAALLHPEFVEIGASGRRYARADLLAHIGPLDPPHTLEVLDVQQLRADQILLLWRGSSAEGSALRASLWVRDGGDWRLRYHQGTPEV